MQCCTNTLQSVNDLMYSSNIQMKNLRFSAIINISVYSEVSPKHNRAVNMVEWFFFLVNQSGWGFQGCRIIQ